MNEIKSLFKAVGNRDYIGEKVTQEQHALQCGKFAKDAGAEDEVVLAALLHDVGHLLGLAEDGQHKQMEGGLGTEDHERLGASFLVSLGFPLKTAELVRRHVDAKRYLCWKNPAYHEKLSEASKGTLLQQGGPMNDEEAKRFEEDSLKDVIIKMRTWDEAAKVVEPAFEVPPLESYREMINRVIEKRKQELIDKNFRFYKLSAEQWESWEKDGFLKLSDLLSEDLKKDVVSWVDEIGNWGPEPGKWMCYYEKAPEGSTDKHMLCRTENFLPFHYRLRNLLTEEGPVMDVLEQLLNERAVLFKEKVNYKLAGGGGFPAHQDAPAFKSFGQRNHLTVNIAVDEATPENGCLQVAPGHHKRGLFPQHPVHGGLSEEEEAKLDNWIDVPLQSGDVLVFNSWLPHRSGANKTSRARRAVYITYNGETDGNFRDKYYEVKRKEFPPLHEREANKDYAEGAKTFNLATPIVF